VLLRRLYVHRKYLIDPSLTQGNKDGCPGGSFCLTQGYCCPNGEDPSTCALNNGVTLSAGFNTAPVAATSAVPSSSVVSISTTSTSTSTAATYSAPTYSSTVFVGTGSANHSVPVPTASVQPFLGGGSKNQDVTVALVGAIAGAAAWVML
jgi:hypothetical protein